jgi:hypothetical protein
MSQVSMDGMQRERERKGAGGGNRGRKEESKNVGKKQDDHCPQERVAL